MPAEFGHPIRIWPQEVSATAPDQGVSRGTSRPVEPVAVGSRGESRRWRTQLQGCRVARRRSALDHPGARGSLGHRARQRPSTRASQEVGSASWIRQWWSHNDAAHDAGGGSRPSLHPPWVPRTSTWQGAPSPSNSGERTPSDTEFPLAAEVITDRLTVMVKVTGDGRDRPSPLSECMCLHVVSR
jgi:hypothetical protein